jgi:major vault protein
MAENERQRDKLLPPGTFLHVLDGTSAQVKTFVGPIAMNLAGQDRAVVYNPATERFDELAQIDQAVQKVITIQEGSYGVLRNPAKDSSIRPDRGKSMNPTELSMGETENLKGPQSLALWPMQSVEVRKGHHLRSNEYLLIKISSDEKARQNWQKAVVKAASGTSTGEGDKPPEASAVIGSAPADLAMGKTYNVLGTEVSFYIPPTGVEVVPDGVDDKGQPVFVRQAETLEQLEYSILVDEDGNKEYPRGPAVVFPKPTQEFLIARRLDGSIIADSDGLPVRKHKAIEINPLQGIQLKFAKNGKLHYADGTEEEYKAGDEKFIRGDKMPIYYPEEGHQLVRYDGKSIHYAVAVTEGEAKYVLERETGNVKLEKGPKMLLPDPVKETIVWRPLSERESRTWFPGSAGTGSVESLAFNEKLRTEAGNSPTTRQGVVSQGQLDKGGPGLEAMALYASTNDFIGASMERGVSYNKSAPARARSSVMAESRQGKDQQAVVADVAERKSTYHEPRTLILGAQKRGVPTIKVQPGYAVNLNKSDGRREAVLGPKTILMEFSDTLDILRLSMGKPKNTDTLFETVYLNIYNNKITDIVEVETSDHVKVQLKLSYNVNFEGDPQKWFTIENYVKHLCDHLRSILKGSIRKRTIEDFYGSSTEVIRDTILGEKPLPLKDGDPTKRLGRLFAENGMRVTDVEVLGVVIPDASIGQLLSQSQHNIVKYNINLSLKEKELEVTRRSEEINRASLDAVSTTNMHKIAILEGELKSNTDLEIAKLQAEQEKAEEQEKVQTLLSTLADLVHDAEIGRNVRAGQASESLERIKQERELQHLQKRVDAVVAQMGAIQPGLVEALQSVSARETLVEVASSLSFHQMLGAGNAAEFIQKAFNGSPLETTISAVLAKAASSLPNNGTVKNQNLPPSQA